MQVMITNNRNKKLKSKLEQYRLRRLSSLISRSYILI